MYITISIEKQVIVKHQSKCECLQKTVKVMQKPQGCYAFQTCLLLVVLRDYCSGVLEKVVYIVDQQSPSRSVMSGEQITEALFFSPQLSMFFGSIDSVELVIFCFVCVCVQVILCCVVLITNFNQLSSTCQFWL